MRSVALVLGTLSTLLVPGFTAPPAEAAGPSLGTGERAVVRAINGARRQNGLGPVRGSMRLSAAADAHTRYMLATGSFAHRDFAGRIRRFTRARRTGETLAMTTRCSARQVVSMWMNSSGHRAVLLSGGFRRVGIGARVGYLGGRRSCVVTADFAS